MGVDIREQIEKLSYEIYEKSGRQPGRDLQNWLTAEKIVLANQAGSGSPGAAGQRRAAPARKKKQASPG
jgi:hypothetical protein